MAKYLFIVVFLLLNIYAAFNFFGDRENTSFVVQKMEISPTGMIIKKLIIGNVPFVVQAPTGEWQESIFQDGCEEASVLMVYCTSNQCPTTDGVIDRNWAKKEIAKLSEWQIKKYGSSTDTSVGDTARRLLDEYFGLSSYEIRNLKDSNDLKDGAWIVPVDGRKLGNPYYTPPGPERHMLLVTGYDLKTDEVITNDPGTRNGKEHRYKRQILWEAIRDYLSGNHEPIVEDKKRAILVSELVGEWI